jgi:hypothetical protein
VDYIDPEDWIISICKIPGCRLRLWAGRCPKHGHMTWPTDPVPMPQRSSSAPVPSRSCQYVERIRCIVGPMRAVIDEEEAIDGHNCVFISHPGNKPRDVCVARAVNHLNRMARLAGESLRYHWIRDYEDGVWRSIVYKIRE